MRGLIFAIIMMVAATAAADSNAPFEERLGEALFTALERELIGEFFRQYPLPVESGKSASGKKGSGGGKSSQMPKGLSKRSSLPPGLARLERHGTFPPGLAKRELPTTLQTRLPVRIKGQERVIVDQDVLLIDIATGLILDIIRGAAGQ